MARGDVDAFGSLFDVVSPTILSITRRVVRDPHHAEEVAQEVLLEVWRLAPRWDRAMGSCHAWVATIAHRRAVDRVRREQAERDRLARDTRLGGAHDPDPVASTVVLEAEVADVADALDRLTDLQREAIELAFYDGHTYATVAQILDVPLGTVKTRIRAGLIRLRSALSEEPPPVPALRS